MPNRQTARRRRTDWKTLIAEIEYCQELGMRLGEFVDSKHLVTVGEALTARHDTLLKNVNKYALAGVMAHVNGWFKQEDR